MKKLLILFCAIAAGTVFAAPVVLKECGKGAANVEIVANFPKADTTGNYAATELQKYLQKLTGLKIKLNKVPGKSAHKIFLCLPDSKYFAPVKEKFVSDLQALKKTDGYAVRQSGNDLYIIGDCPKALLNGVYRFLMKNSDIIWPRPAKGIAIFTPVKSLTFNAVNYIDIAKFKYRGWGWNYSRTVKSDELNIWRARMCFNLPGGPASPRNAKLERKLAFRDGFCIRGQAQGHNMVSHYLPDTVHGKAHPEYYMLVDGQRYVKRNANPCYTNEDVPRIIAEKALQELRSSKLPVSIMVIQNSDQGLTCECENCVKPIKLADGSLLTIKDEAFRSTQFFIFFNKIARMIGKEFPDVLIQTYGYMFTAIPPKVALEPNIAISYCPYIRNDKEPLSGPSNKKWQIRTDGWLKLTNNLLLREYYYSGARFPRPLAEIMVQDLRYLQKHNIPYVTSEFTWSDDEHKPGDGVFAKYFWDLTAGEVWVMSQLLWDPHQDVTALRSDFLKRTYKEAAPAMEEFYRLIREAWLNDPRPSAFNDNIVKSFSYYIIGKKIDKKCLAALNKAMNNVKHPESRKLVALALERFKMYLNMAKAEAVLELNVPKLSAEKAPGFDLASGVWAKAAVLSPLFQLNRVGLKAVSDVTVKIFHDGRKLYIGTRVKKAPADLFCRAFAERDAGFPSGDHVEFFFVNRKDKYYYQLAWDYKGSIYDAKTTDTKWNGKWDLRTCENPDGWSSVFSIPLDETGMTLLQNNKLSATIMLTVRQSNGRNEAAIWGGGRVHSPDSFGDLILDLE